MNLLVDTHALLWFAAGDERLSRKARAAIESRDTISYVSIASWWEIAVKCSLDKLRLGAALEDFMNDRIAEGFRVLPIDPPHLVRVATLPFHHRDPFDRLIVCQALAENMPVCTGDGRFKPYGVAMVW